MATRDHSTTASEFQLACNCIRLSLLVRDPFVADAFRRAEDDGDFPMFVEIDHPPSLIGGAAERMTFGTRRTLELVEG